MRTNVWMAVAAALAAAGCNPGTPPAPPPVVTPQPPPRPSYDFTFTLKHKVKADGIVMAPGFSPDGRHVAAVIHGQGLAVWETAGWERVNLKSKQARDWGLAVWSPSGRYLAVAQGPPACVELIEWKERRSVAVFDKIEYQTEDGDNPQEVIFSSEEKFLAVGWVNGTVTIHSVSNAEHKLTLAEGHGSVPLYFSDSSQELVTSGSPAIESSNPILRREAGLRSYSTNPWALNNCLFDGEVGSHQGGRIGADRFLTLGKLEANSTVIKAWSRNPLKQLSRRTHKAVLVGCAIHPQTEHVASTESAKQDGSPKILGIRLMDPLGEYSQSVATVDSIAKGIGEAPKGRMNLSFGSAAFSSDGKQLSIGFYEGWLLIFDVEFKKLP